MYETARASEQPTLAPTNVLLSVTVIVAARDVRNGSANSARATTLRANLLTKEYDPTNIVFLQLDTWLASLLSEKLRGQDTDGMRTARPLKRFLAHRNLVVEAQTNSLGSELQSPLVQPPDAGIAPKAKNDSVRRGLARRGQIGERCHVAAARGLPELPLLQSGTSGCDGIAAFSAAALQRRQRLRVVGLNRLRPAQKLSRSQESATDSSVRNTGLASMSRSASRSPSGTWYACGQIIVS